MSALVGGEVLSFAQVSPTPPEGSTVTYTGRISVPAGAYGIDVYWYTRSDWTNTQVSLAAVAEVGILINGEPSTDVVNEIEVNESDSGGTFKMTGQPANSVEDGTSVVSDATQDFVFTLTETVGEDSSSTGVILVGAVWVTPSVSVVTDVVVS